MPDPNPSARLSGPPDQPFEARSCPVATEDALPTCGSGPFERLRFVARELAGLWRGRRDRQEEH